MHVPGIPGLSWLIPVARSGAGWGGGGDSGNRQLLFIRSDCFAGQVYSSSPAVARNFFGHCSPISDSGQQVVASKAAFVEQTSVAAVVLDFGEVELRAIIRVACGCCSADRHSLGFEKKRPRVAEGGSTAQPSRPDILRTVQVFHSVGDAYAKRWAPALPRQIASVLDARTVRRGHVCEYCRPSMPPPPSRYPRTWQSHLTLACVGRSSCASRKALRLSAPA